MRVKIIKQCALLILLLTGISGFTQTSKKNKFAFTLFSKINYDKVICYSCDPSKDGLILMNQNQIVNSKIVKDSKEMTQVQTDSLHAKFVYKLLPSNEKTGKDFYYQDVAFVYYFKNKIVAYFSIPAYGNVIDLFFVKNDNDQKDAVNIYRCSFAEADRKQLKYICGDLNLQCCK